jgi:hypothetical protein
MADSQAPDRVFFRDIKPYETPETLEDLRGPAGGPVTLPHTVWWAPGGGQIDLDSPAGLRMAYQAVISEGSAADQVELLDRHLLLGMWPRLVLPVRVRSLWESRFPELCAEGA